MKTTIALVIAAVAILLIVLKNNDKAPVSTTNPDPKSPASDASSPTAPAVVSSKPERPTRSDQKREISQRTKTASWHPTQKGDLVSPYNDEILAAIGVVSGSKMTDSDGNEFIVPPFEDSPFPIDPIGAGIPGQPGFIFNPWTQKAVDVRGVPPGSLVRDPNDPDLEHKLRTPLAE